MASSIVSRSFFLYLHILGAVNLEHRIALAPLTRFRASDDHVPLPFVAEYYAQRASVPGTLLISEGTIIAPQGGGYGNAPGIWTQAQIDAWKKVTEAVHAKKSYIYMQLFALGRGASAEVLEKDGYGAKVKAPSPIAIKDGPQPEELTEAEIEEYITLYTQAAKNAIEAGFDGVEIHGANGYLLDQFLQDVSNKRIDAWGGSIEKRARLGIEVTKSIVNAIGADRTAYRLSPYSSFQDMKMADPVPQFSYIAQELKKLKIAYLHLIEGRIDGNTEVESEGEKLDFLVDIWDNVSPLFLAGGFTPDTAKKAVDEVYKGKDVVMVFGRHFISNPDLVYRIKEGIELTPYDRNLFYNAKEEKGYTTWEFSKEFEANQSQL
ncbi:NADh:flavin oxidoreductase NADh oxidase family protein [Rutstroemia sp. NJR-2017a WRK4]|nr:NADh:flavin oxidoreductase NADh oxidase family protein [Rutstroemia sp. NJR-2017a WRK4]